MAWISDYTTIAGIVAVICGMLLLAVNFRRATSFLLVAATWAISKLFASS